MNAAVELLARCIELQEAQIAGAVAIRADVRALLERMAAISAPDTGAAKVMLIYARLATTACDWMDGDLIIDLVDEGRITVVESYTELGGGLRERLFPPLSFDAPLAEFVRAAARVPHMIAPLVMRSMGERRVRLSASEHVRRTSFPPPPIAIAAESLFAEAAPMPSDSLGRIEPEYPSTLPIVHRRPPAPSYAAPSAPTPQVEADAQLQDVDSGWDE
ncbi:MAG: hypothetical protein ABSC94_19870 [Polyangiaceae bacterium]|jgi:hypothetical protein